MAIHQLTLRFGQGAFLLNGEELTYDTAPVGDGVAVGGRIDFSDRPVEEARMLRNNADAALADESVRTQAVLYGQHTV